MQTWHIRAEYRGSLGELSDEQAEQLAAVAPVVMSLADGHTELRFDVHADDLAAAASAACTHLASADAITSRVAAGTLTGPHCVEVADDLAHARTLPMVGATEAAARMGITTARLRQLRAEDPAFPAPRLRLAAGDIWDAAEIDHYNRTRERGKPGRPRKQ